VPALSIMKSFRVVVLLLFIFVLDSASQITLNPSPTRVIGQVSTTLSSISPNLVEGREFQAPQNIAVDRSTNPAAIYVSDTGNNRVLGFRSSTGFANGQMADVVIGQPDFLTTVPGGPNFNSTRTTGVTAPEGVAVDASGNLYVIDSGNNRILRFPKPFAQTGTQTPDLVIGQADFSTGTANLGGLSASSLMFLNGSSALAASLTFDAVGNLWVPDAGNNRILRFNANVLGSKPASKPAADLVLGQPGFLTNSAGSPVPPLTSLSAIHSPTGIAFDSSGRLFASESVTGQRGRVMAWFPPFTNGLAASAILGAGSASTANINEFQFSQSPSGLFAVGNQIGVADTYNNRLLLFPPVEQWTSNTFYQAAVAVIGQADFSTGDVNRGAVSAGPATLARPVGVVYLNSELYVADTANHRVIVLPQSGSSFSPATRVLGQTQTDLNTVDLIEGREFYFSGGNGDAGLAVDLSSSVPHLYVADTYNNRILGFNDVRNIQPGAKADIVIGQPDFLHSINNYPSNQPTSSSLSNPTGVVVDSTGNLYVADSGNGRVLRFPSPFANYQPGVPETADLVLGQLSFTSKITDATSQTMGAPYGVAFAGTHGLLVSDLRNNRVLLFAGTSQQLTNGQAASTVFGQPDMNSSSPGSGPNQLNAPRNIATDSDDRLYVADTGNVRVQIFDRAPSAGNGAFAAISLTKNLSSPRGVHVNPTTGDVWVADAGTNSAIRYPQYNQLAAGNTAPNTALSDYVPLAVAEDKWGNVLVADNANRIVIYYPGLSALNGANFLGMNSKPVAFPLAPGLIAALYSTGAPGQFGSTTQAASTVPLPKQLNGIQVLVNNTPAALFAAGPDQINFEVPRNAPQSGAAEILVLEVATGRVLGDTTVAMYSVSPGIFTQAANGIGAAIIVNQDGTLNSQSNYAAQGSIVTIYMTGQGFIDGMPADGEGAPTALRTPYVPTVYVGGANNVPPEDVLYSGLAPTQVGVWQINVRVPVDAITLPTSPTQVLVQANSVPSGGGALGRPVFIYVKRP
jgi:uncharacterized protein (TIGR03437 family)